MVQGVAQAGSGISQFAIATDGTLVYVPGAAIFGLGEATMVWVDREGREEPLSLPAAGYRRPRLSPDGSRVAMDILDVETSSDVWMSEVARGTLSLVTTDAGPDTRPLWTPDGQRVVFTSSREGPIGLFSKAADGSGGVEQLAVFEDTPFVGAMAWSPDGDELVFVYVTPETRGDIGVLSMEGEGT